MKRLVLGIDGGGTKTAAVALDLDSLSGGPHGPVGLAGPSNIAAVSIDEAAECILAAASATGARREDVAAVCAAVAGVSFRERREQLCARLSKAFEGAHVQVVPDYAAAFTGALGGRPGIVAIAGTGSVVYGENAAGVSHRAGAYGYLIDDGGSGYGVGRRAVAAVLRAIDGTGQKTALAARLAEDLGLSSWEEMIAGVYGGAIDRIRIAGLARCVAQAAGEVDPVALSILEEAGEDLARLAGAVARRLFAPDEVCDVAAVGSLWEAGEPLSEAFFRSLSRAGIRAVRATVRFNPATGAALRAASSVAAGAGQGFRD